MHQFAGIPNYPAGHTEPRHAFRAALAAPLHDRSLRRPDAGPPVGAVEITGAWRLLLPASAGDQLRTAAADFASFMSVCMEVSGWDSAPPSAEGAEIRLLLASALPPEAYRLNVVSDEITPSALTLTASDETGLQYALYDLEDRMTDAGGPWLEPATVERAPFLETRILRSFFSPFYVNELLDDVDYYPEEYLNRLAHHRLNGVWMHAILRDIVPSALFPEFGAQSAPMLAKLRAVVARAARYGIKVYLYFLEPRSFPQTDPFWERHPDLRGARSDGWAGSFAFCTSAPLTLEWLTEASSRLFTEVPGLGGAFLITASELQTNCFSHAGRTGEESDPQYTAKITCPRCSQRTPEAVVDEIVTAIARGVHAVAPLAKVIAWDWSWSMLWGEATTDRIIAGLPDDSILMCDYERGDEKTILGKTIWMDEYALSLTGPSRRFRRCEEAAKKRGLPLYVKLQFLNTHELGDVPWTPLPTIVYDKLSGMQRHGVQGMLGCWIFGNYPGMISDFAGRAYFGAEPEQRRVRLEWLAGRYFSAEARKEILRAWEWFASAWSYYPFHIPLLYAGPHVAGPAFPWFLEPIHKLFPQNWLANQEPGDNMLGQILDGEVLWFDACLGEILNHWAQGIAEMEAALAHLPAPTLDQQQEYGLVRCCYHQMLTLRHTARFYVEREFLLRSDKLEERRAILQRLQAYIHQEIANAEACLPFVEADSRLGWHSEVFDYQFTPEAIRARVANLRQMAEETIPAWLATDGGLIPPQPYEEEMSAAPFRMIKEKLGALDLVRRIYPT
jgi:hypothetical protein